MAASSICVYIDIREDDLWAELAPYHVPSDEGWHVEKKVLDVGDIAFCPAVDDVSGSRATYVLLERKTAEDLGASQKDGRYREQRTRLYAMRGAGAAIGYIIEAPSWSPSLNRSWCRGAFTEVHLQQAIARLQLRHTIPVFQACTIQGTLQWIRRIAKALVADPTAYACGMASRACDVAAVYKDTIHVHKASNNTPERIFLSMLLSIPGLGKASAEAIASATHSSFTTLQAMTEKELSEIKAGKRSVGKVVGRAVYAAIHT